MTAPDAGNPAGRPHALIARHLPGGGLEVVYATRAGTNAWELQTVDKVQGLQDTLRPIAIVVGADGGLRFLYGKRQGGQEQIAIAWPENGGIGHGVLANGMFPVGANVVADGAGRFHVAYYKFTGADYTVHYLQAGP